jgi:hypothetical protein
VILKEAIADDLRPTCRGGITFYPAASIARIFDWADAQGGTLEWIEGVFYCPDTDEGQLSLSYMCERAHESYTDFRASCIRLALEMDTEASAKGMGAYFGLGISDGEC